MWKALASKVIACAVLTLKDDGSIFEWACYMDSVPGYNHEEEYQKVVEFGDKVEQHIAKAIFPTLKGNKYRGIK